MATTAQQQTGPRQIGFNPANQGKPGYFGEYEGYVYDPWANNGQGGYRPDINAQKEYYQQQGLLEPDKKEPGLGEQMIPVLAGGLTAAAATYFGKDLLSPALQYTAKQIGLASTANNAGGLTPAGEAIFNGMGNEGAGYITTGSQPVLDGGQAIGGGEAIGGGAADSGLMAASQGSNLTSSTVTAAYPVQQMADGSVLLSDGTTLTGEAAAQASNSAAQGGNAAAAGVEAGKGGIGGTGIGAQGGWAGWLSVIAEGAQAYMALKNRDNPDDQDRAQETTKHAGLAVAGYFTGGLVPLVYSLFMQTGFGRKVERKVKKWDKSLGMISPVSNKLITGGLKTLGFGKSTKGFEAARRMDLAKWAPMSAEASMMAHTDDDDGIWDTGRYAGQKWDFEKAKDLVLNPESDTDKIAFIGMLGNFETFGDVWLGVPLEQQVEITRRITQEDLYSSDKGDVIISDKDGKQDRAKEIFNEVTGANIDELQSALAQERERLEAEAAAAEASQPDETNSEQPQEENIQQ